MNKHIDSVGSLVSNLIEKYEANFTRLLSAIDNVKAKMLGDTASAPLGTLSSMMSQPLVVEGIHSKLGGF